jgi:hypothetical protein
MNLRYAHVATQRSAIRQTARFAIALSLRSSFHATLNSKVLSVSVALGEQEVQFVVLVRWDIKASTLINLTATQLNGTIMPKVDLHKYFAALGRKGGSKSKRVLTPEQARAMVKAREKKRKK